MSGAFPPLGTRRDSAPPPPILEVRNLRVAYGAVTAVHDLSLRVSAGTAVAVLGANGAGKSSALRAIGGLTAIRSGEVRFAGSRIDGAPAEKLVRAGLAMVTDTRDLFPRFSVERNLRMGGLRLQRAEWSTALEEVLALFPALSRLLRRPAWTLSGGEQQMLALGRALLTRPRLLLLDEPSLGLAPLIVENIFTALASIVSRGTAVLLVEQSTAAALRLSTHAYVLRTGHLALEGPSETLRADARVLDLYLGGGDDLTRKPPATTAGAWQVSE